MNTTTTQNTVAIVTGGTRGIGAAITERLIREGHHVAAAYAGNDASARIGSFTPTHWIGIP